MATKYHKTICSYWIIMLVATLNTISQGFVEVSHTFDKSKFGPAPNGTMRTIEVPEDGDIIDCVDIYKQPAFNDPRIKDLKMAPSKSYVSLFNRTINQQSNVIQNWRKHGECPKGTVPIRRTLKHKRTIHHHRISNDDDDDHEYAIATEEGSTYHGGGATFNLWNPRVREEKEFSLAQLWVVSGDQPNRNIIEAGWIVYPHHYGDSQTRLFSYWTADDYRHTGCYNKECPGFVQTNDQWTLGGVLNHVSTFQGQQIELRITLSRDWETKDWWLEVGGTQIGYFDHNKFTTLQNGANAKVEFGGEIVNEKPSHKHTGTYMGSGRFPYEGSGKAAYIRNIQVADDRYDVVDASLTSFTTRPECYDLIFGPPETTSGVYFYYGGPGFSRHCYVG